MTRDLRSSGQEEAVRFSLSIRRKRFTHRSGLVRRSHSHIRMTEKPLALSLREIAASRLLFLAIFARQYSLFVWGICPQRGQPCQKHPSTNTTTRWPLNQKSGWPRMCRGRTFQCLSLAARKNERKRASVVLLELEVIARMFILRRELGGRKAGSLLVNRPVPIGKHSGRVLLILQDR